MERVLEETKNMAKSKAPVVHQQGRTGSGALKKKLWQMENRENLCRDGGLVLPDMREGEVAIGTLWEKLHEEIYGDKGKLPYVFDFSM